MRKLFVSLALSSLVLAVAACASARRSMPLVVIEDVPQQFEQGHEVFDHYCNHCHPNGAAGLGPALNNKPLASPVVRLQVREGIGMMPAFAPDQISDEELDQLLAYLDWLDDVKLKPQPETETGT